jgi:hypothetical protein
MKVILKTLHILHRPEPQNPEYVHAGFCPFGSRATAAAASNAIPATQNKKKLGAKSAS